LTGRSISARFRRLRPLPHTVLSYLPCLPERGGGRYFPPRRDAARHRRRNDEPDRAPEPRRQRNGRDLRLAVRALQGVVARPVADLQIASSACCCRGAVSLPRRCYTPFRDILVAAAHRSATLSSLVPGSRGRARSNSGRGNRCSTCRIRRQLAGTWVRPSCKHPVCAHLDDRRAGTTSE